MFDKLFPSFKQAAFVLLLLASGVAVLFGYTDWVPTPEQEAFVSGLGLLIGSLLGLGVGAKIVRK